MQADKSQFQNEVIRNIRNDFIECLKNSSINEKKN